MIVRADTLVFSSTLAVPHRRAIYLASLEAHIDRLHSQVSINVLHLIAKSLNTCQLFSLKLYPIDTQVLSSYKGLNCKAAKVGPTSDPFLYFATCSPLAPVSLLGASNLQSGPATVGGSIFSFARTIAAPALPSASHHVLDPLPTLNFFRSIRHSAQV